MRYALLALLLAVPAASAAGRPPGCTGTQSSWPAGGGRRLVETQCALGASQGTSMLHLVGPGARRVGPLALVTYRDPRSGRPRVVRETVVLGTLAFSKGTLTVLDKFRGIGDCGIYSVFRLARSRFVPVEARAKTACDGKSGGGPTRWPRLPTPAP